MAGYARQRWHVVAGLALTLLSACTPVVDAPARDADGDGYTDDVDCNDADPTIHPDATERCDDVDHDCTGRVDDVLDPPRWAIDRDDDGFADPRVTVSACTAPPAYVAADGPTDCLDLDPTVFPGAVEVPGDGVDQDCDGQEACFVDEDDDGFGSETTVATDALACDVPGVAANADDCNDGDGTIYPEAPERCGPADRDCDGDIGNLDEDAVDRTLWFPDADGDGWGRPTGATTACVEPDFTVANDLDCQDGDAAVNPLAEEVCDGIDNDCDGWVDDADTVPNPPTWFADVDGDGFGDPDARRERCAPTGTFSAANGQDCNDVLAFVNPDATDAPGNALDEDCDGDLACYVDGDGDGVAGATVGDALGPSCVQPGFDETIADCDDQDPQVQRFTYWADLDGDGWGDPDVTLAACVTPAFFTTRAGDCDDRAASVNPDATEQPGDSRDSDCNGIELCWIDADGDAAGGPLTAPSADVTCPEPGLTIVGGDCDDGDPTRHPLALERIGDGVDGNCDGVEQCFLDSDGDGVGVPVVVPVAGSTCDGFGVSAVLGDCDDTRPAWTTTCPYDTVHVGDAYACARRLDDTVRCVANGADAPSPSVPLVQLSVWDTTGCGVEADGTPHCWGAGADTTFAPPPEAFTHIDVGPSVACGVTLQGTVQCWGDDTSGLLAVPDVSDVWSVSVGDDVACVIHGANAIRCWGDDTCDAGTQATTGTTVEAGVGAVCTLDDDVLACTGCGTVVSGAQPSPPARYGSVHLSYEAACASTPAGLPRCWGEGAAPGAPNVPSVSLSIGTSDGCLVDDDGFIQCWGDTPLF